MVYQDAVGHGDPLLCFHIVDIWLGTGLGQRAPRFMSSRKTCDNLHFMDGLLHPMLDVIIRLACSQHSRKKAVLYRCRMRRSQARLVHWNLISRPFNISSSVRLSIPQNLVQEASFLTTCPYDSVLSEQELLRHYLHMHREGR